MAEALVRMERINKFFGRVQALDDVHFRVARREHGRPPPAVPGSAPRARRPAAR